VLAWKQATEGLLSDERRTMLLTRLMEGESISKSTYAELCSVALATASKHLGLLAERGLLIQTGKGPSTRYHLPQ
jgi:DeoR/GlpR family transcriptional regulator of sugar metabolism